MTTNVQAARRNPLRGILFVVLPLLVAIAGAGFYFFIWSDGATSPAVGATNSASAAELMAPGPLEDMSLGDPNAPVTIIEYASMTCPHCAHFEEATFPELKKQYIDTGKVRLIFREFPLDPLAAAGSQLARCSGKDNYFAVIEILFKQQKDWVVRQPIPALTAIAKQLGFTQQSFEQCMANQKLLADIEAVRERAASKFGVNSTPTFFINGTLYRGALELADIAKAIEPYLKS
jgi:protein-disulfide isomerase